MGIEECVLWSWEGVWVSESCEAGSCGKLTVGSLEVELLL